MDLEEWKNKSTEVEQSFSSLLCDRVWDEYKLPEESQLLKKKIAYSLYGKWKSNEDEEDLEDEDGFVILNIPCNEAETNLINEIHLKCVNYSDEILKDNNKVHLAFLFVCVYHKEPAAEGIFPLIRLRRDATGSEDVANSYYIDHTGRVYVSWDGYLNENTWNGCWLCLPANGRYNAEHQVTFHDQSERGKVVASLDKASHISSVTCGVVGVTSLALMSTTPIAAPLAASVLTTTAIASLIPATYSSVRNVGSLIDRGKHDQSLNPVHCKEARGYWIATAASVLSLGTMGVEKFFRLGGHFASSASLRYLCNSVNIVRLSADGIHILNAIIKMSEREDKVSKVELIELIKDIFFFTHSVLSFHTAKAVINEAQHHSQHPTTADVAENDEEENAEAQMENGRIQYIKPIKHINNKDEFYLHFQS